MSGHSKWAKIKHKKAITDAKKSKAFGKIVRFITVESKKAKGDVNAPGLRVAIEKAKANNVPGDTIDRAVSKGKTDTSAAMNEVTFEAYGPGGVAIIIEGLTDNNNRTSQEVKQVLSKNGSALAAQGSASWAFTREGREWKPSTMVSISEEDGVKLEALVDALEDLDDIQEIYTNAE